LLTAVSGKLSPEVLDSWRWRILFDRATIDVGLHATGGQVAGHTLTTAFADLIALYHADQAQTYLHPPIPSNHSCSATPAPAHTCTLDSKRGPFIEWVRVVNESNVYGTTISGGPTTPLLGEFKSEVGCKAACTVLGSRNHCV
jgi:hypothetical protein